MTGKRWAALDAERQSCFTAGHAGVEAALASARMGCQTLLLSINIDTIGLGPPSLWMSHADKTLASYFFGLAAAMEMPRA